MSTAAAPVSTPNTAGKSAWICLAIAWICFLLPIPGLGLFIGWPLNLVAFILAIVAMSKRGAMGGLFQLLASLIASPVVYLIGLAIFGGSLGALNKVAQEAKAEKEARAASTPSAQIGEAATTPAAREPIVIQAKALMEAYKANERSAEERFTGNPVRVTGTIKSPVILPDRTSIGLEGRGNSGVFIFGLTPADGKGLKDGQQITLNCIGGGTIQNAPALKDCRISN